MKSLKSFEKMFGDMAKAMESSTKMHMRTDVMITVCTIAFSCAFIAASIAMVASVYENTQE